MKGAYVFILLMAATAVATKWHVRKDNAQGDKIGRLDAGLKEVKAHIPPGANFSVKMPEGTPPDVYILWAYLMAPRYASMIPKESYDTVLTICTMNVTDSAMHSITDHRKLICSSSDGQYKYFLTSKVR
jgi:hypothetical protein